MSSGPPLGLLFALAAMCALCSSSSAAAGGFALMGDSGSSNNSRTPAGPTAGPTAPVVTTVKGYPQAPIVVQDVTGITTPEGCKAPAKLAGATSWVHRNSTHPSMPNSCQLNAWADLYPGDDTDTIHVTGCTYGGNPKTGCTPWPAIRGFPGAGSVNVTPSAEFSTMDPNACVTKAKEINALSWGYRTKNHPSNPNTCFFYSNFNAGFTGDSDPNHMTGCTNGKSLSTKCV